MPSFTFRFSDEDAAGLEKLARKRGRDKSKAMRDLVAEELERCDERRGVPKVATKKECLEILSDRARSGNVNACRLLLEKPWEKKHADVVEQVDEFADLDELAVRRKVR